MKFIDAMAGSEIVALLARLGGGPPRLMADGRLALVNQEVDNRLLSRFDRDKIRDQVLAYYGALNTAGDDQGFALMLIDRMIRQAKAGELAPESDRLLFLMGGGGCGKTEVIAQAVKRGVEAGLSSICVVAPTNRAVRVLRKRISDIAGRSSAVRVGTAHAVFKKLALNELGDGILDHFIAGQKGQLHLPHVDVETLADVNDVYERFTFNPKAMKRALGLAARLNSAPDPDAVRHAILKEIGFRELDTRVFHWLDQIAGAQLVICDEVSMVPSAIPRAALAAGAFVICSGDAAQLEPVSLDYSDSFGMVRRDEPAIHMATAANSVFLWQNRRTSNDSAISELANFALRARSFSEFRMKALEMAKDPGVPEIQHTPTVRSVPLDDLRAVLPGDPEEGAKGGVVLTYTNSRRHESNKLIRQLLGYPEDRIVPGDKFFVSSVNPHDRGSDGPVKDEFLTYVEMDSAAGDHEFSTWAFSDEGGRTITTSSVSLYDPLAKNIRDIEYFEEFRGSGVSVIDNTFYASPGELILSPAFALTIHKSQGSEWPVVTLDLRSLGYEMLSEEDDTTPGLGGARWKRWRRLAYTACSRARRKINVLG
jgi:hypothetical protein